MSIYRVWELAKDAFRIQGGTIHQIAQMLGMNGTSYLMDLDMQNGSDCKVLIGKQWIGAVFLEYTDIKKDQSGNYWLAGSAFVPGFNGGGHLTNLKVGYTLKA